MLLKWEESRSFHFLQEDLNWAANLEFEESFRAKVAGTLKEFIDASVSFKSIGVVKQESGPYSFECVAEVNVPNRFLELAFCLRSRNADDLKVEVSYLDQIKTQELESMYQDGLARCINVFRASYQRCLETHGAKPLGSLEEFQSELTEALQWKAPPVTPEEPAPQTL